MCDERISTLGLLHIEVTVMQKMEFDDLIDDCSTPYVKEQVLFLKRGMLNIIGIICVIFHCYISGPVYPYHLFNTILYIPK